MAAMMGFLPWVRLERPPKPEGGRVGPGLEDDDEVVDASHSAGCQRTDHQTQ